MYIIADIIYGVPLISNIWKVFSEDEINDFDFEILYHGNREYQPGYLGEHVCSIDECRDVPASYFSPTVTDQTKQNAQDKYDALPDKVKNILHESGIDKPDLYVIWSSS